MLRLNEDLFVDFDEIENPELPIEIKEEEKEGPQTSEDNGLLNLFTQAINDEWQTITLYNNIIETLKTLGKDDMINVINDINTEENKHVGQLLELLKIIAPNTSNIASGEVEAQLQLSEDLEEGDFDHIGSIQDGHLVEFPNSAKTFMKVCTNEGQGGIVDITTGELIMTRDLEKHGLGFLCHEIPQQKILVSESLNEDSHTKDHSRTFYQKDMADIFMKDLEDKGACDISVSSFKNLGFVNYVVEWNDCEELTEAETLHPKFKKDIKNKYKRYSREEDRKAQKRKEIDDIYSDLPLDKVDKIGKSREDIYDLLDATPSKFKGKIENNRGNLEAHDYPFYVTYYSEYPIYEPAEGGYYYPGRNADWSKGFNTREEAVAYLNDYVRNDDDSDWHKQGRDSYTTYSKYIGDEQLIRVEKNKAYLSDEAGWHPYE